MPPEGTPGIRPPLSGTPPLGIPPPETLVGGAANAGGSGTGPLDPGVGMRCDAGGAAGGGAIMGGGGAATGPGTRGAALAVIEEYSGENAGANAGVRAGGGAATHGGGPCAVPGCTG